MLHIELNKLAPQQVKEINELRKMGVPDDIIQMGIDNENRKLQESLSDAFYHKVQGDSKESKSK